MSDSDDEGSKKEAVVDGTAEVLLKCVQPHSAVEHLVKLDFTVPIDTLKDEMEAVVNIPADQQEWKFKGTVLQDTHTLFQYFKYAGATVEVRKVDA